MTNVEVLAAAVATAFVLASSPSQAECLHKAVKSDDQRARSHAAVRFVAQVNAAQARSHREIGTYVPLEASRVLSAVPVGFVPRLVLDQWGYLLSVKDLFDPCGFTLFSDEQGRIYTAHPAALDEMQPVPRSQDNEANASSR